MYVKGCYLTETLMTKQHVPGVKVGHELCWLKIVKNNEVYLLLLSIILQSQFTM